VSTTVQGRERYFPTQRITMKSSTASTMSRTDALRAEKALVQSSMKSTSPAPLWSGSWLVPTRGRATSAYGRRRYVNGKWWGQHNGADIKAPTGAAVVATNSGRVVLSQNLPTLRGNTIVIDHGCNVFSIYMHLSQRAVRVGQSVARGQLIGRVGATGFVTGAHLHWEVRIGWEPVDPSKVTARGLQF
jgi:murein DD-endopeptidase MepM/ murein hydrolase activator NlpD